MGKKPTPAEKQSDLTCLYPDPHGGWPADLHGKPIYIGVTGQDSQSKLLLTSLVGTKLSSNINEIIGGIRPDMQPLLETSISNLIEPYRVNARIVDPATNSQIFKLHNTKHKAVLIGFYPLSMGDAIRFKNQKNQRTMIWNYTLNITPNIRVILVYMPERLQTSQGLRFVRCFEQFLKHEFMHALFGSKDISNQDVHYDGRKGCERAKDAQPLDCSETIMASAVNHCRSYGERYHELSASGIYINPYTGQIDPVSIEIDSCPGTLGELDEIAIKRYVAAENSVSTSSTSTSSSTYSGRIELAAATFGNKVWTLVNNITDIVAHQLDAGMDSFTQGLLNYSAQLAQDCPTYFPPNGMVSCATGAPFPGSANSTRALATPNWRGLLPANSSQALTTSALRGLPPPPSPTFGLGM